MCFQNQQTGHPSPSLTSLRILCSCSAQTLLMEVFHASVELLEEVQKH